MQDAEKSIKHRSDSECSEGIVQGVFFLELCVASFRSGRKKNCEAQEKPHLHPTTTRPPPPTATPPSLSYIYRPPFSSLLSQRIKILQADEDGNQDGGNGALGGSLLSEVWMDSVFLPLISPSIPFALVLQERVVANISLRYIVIIIMVSLHWSLPGSGGIFFFSRL